MPADTNRDEIKGRTNKPDEIKRRSSSPSESYIFLPATRSGIAQPTKDRPHCKVFLLDGQYYTIPVHKKAKGNVIINEVFRHLELKDLQEREYFSIYYVDLSGSKIFLNPFKQIRKQLPHASSRTTWELFFGVQFYATNLDMLADEMTRYLFVLQMCRDIKEKRIDADRSTKLQLVSLLVQASCGDYDSEEHKPGYVEPYIDMIYNPSEIPVGLDSSVVEAHKEKTGFKPSEADNAFFMIVKYFYKYGQQIFPVRDRLDQSGQIGASILGLYFHKDGREFMNIPWEDVITIGYRKKKFRIKYHPKGSSDGTEHMLYLLCFEPNSKLVWRGCVEQHAFFRLEKPTPLVENTIRSYHSFKRNSELRFSRGRTLYQMLRSERKHRPEFQRSLPIIYPTQSNDELDVFRSDGDLKPEHVKSLTTVTPSPINEPEPSRQGDSKFYMTVEITKSEPDLTRVVEFSATEKQRCSFTVTFKERTPSPPMLPNPIILDGRYRNHSDSYPAAQYPLENPDMQDKTVTAIAVDIDASTMSPTFDETLIEAEQSKVSYVNKFRNYD